MPSYQLTARGRGVVREIREIREIIARGRGEVREIREIIARGRGEVREIREIIARGRGEGAARRRYDGRRSLGCSDGDPAAQVGASISPASPRPSPRPSPRGDGISPPIFPNGQSESERPWRWGQRHELRPM